MRYLLLIVVMLGFHTRAQTYFKDHFGGTVSIIANIGSHNTSVGFGVNGYYKDYFYQFNFGSTFLLYEHSLGNRRRFMENRTTLGVLLLGGKEEREIDFEMSPLNHQTNKNLGIGYSYIIYSDSRQTSQHSGAFSLHINHFSGYHENDIFGGRGQDRYRTGQLHASYQYGIYKFSGGIQMWTGKTNSAPLNQDNCQHCPAGYRNLYNEPYGKTSHGNAYLGVSMHAGMGQTGNFKYGVDSERVRHIFQNRLIHNLGQIINKPTPHYPMLNSEGYPVYDKELKRPNKHYIQLGLNNNWWY